MAHRFARACGAEPVTVEPREDDGDVVRPAALVREPDQPLAGGSHIGRRGHDPGDLVVLDLAREAVGAKHEDITLADVLVGEVHLHPGIRPQRLQDDVAPLALRRLLLRELPRLHEPLHQRLILRELVGLAVADEIGPAVSDLGDVTALTQHAGGRGGRAHPPRLGVGLRVRVDVSVRRLDRFLEPVGETLRGRLPLAPPCLDHLVVDGLDGHLARELARRGAAHPVRHDEQGAAAAHFVVPHVWEQRSLPAREIRNEEAILVVVARLAQIGLGPDLDSNRLRRATEHSSGPAGAVTGDAPGGARRAGGQQGRGHSNWPANLSGKLAGRKARW